MQVLLLIVMMPRDERPRNTDFSQQRAARRTPSRHHTLVATLEHSTAARPGLCFVPRASLRVAQAVALPASECSLWSPPFPWRRRLPGTLQALSTMYRNLEALPFVPSLCGRPDSRRGLAERSRNWHHGCIDRRQLR